MRSGGFDWTGCHYYVYDLSVISSAPPSATAHLPTFHLLLILALFHRRGSERSTCGKLLVMTTGLHFQV
jgi:hypothetical protein